jgi:tagatose-1,6-bisphosphate aldolase non-catalytic subunit AgaZ/GatZ
MSQPSSAAPGPRAAAQPRLADLLAGASGRKFTLLGVGPVSEAVLEAAFAVSARRAFPPMFIASRNQVDAARFGGGYLLGGLDQAGFTALIRAKQERAGYRGPLYICRDHGGPWQRDEELKSRLPVGRAMELARLSLEEDLRAGFNYLHLDPTKCPHPFTQGELADWTLELVEHCERVRSRLGVPPVDYEIGAEDIRGGITTEENFAAFLERVTAGLARAALPAPTCIVGQTGTLTRMDRNVGRFDREQTARLAAVAARFGVGLKEHNGDYLSAASCRVHPELGVTGMNVAPEFGLVETDALLALVELEGKLAREGWIEGSRLSGLAEGLRELAFAKAPWDKWLTPELKARPRAELEKDEAVRLRITRVCGHYLFADPAIRAARERLYENVERFELTERGPEAFVAGRIEKAIDFYARHFRLEGLNSALAGEAAGG